MRRLATVSGLLAAPTTVYIAALVLAPGRASVLTHIYLVVVSAGALAALVLALARALRTAEASMFERGLQRIAWPHERVRQLQRLEREVTLGRQSAWDLHNRLCPTLRETAAALLAGRGVDIEREPAQAQQLLGEDAWELVRLDRAPPEHRHAPGVSAASLDRAVAALEGL